MLILTEFEVRPAASALKPCWQDDQLGLSIGWLPRTAPISSSLA
jgi:hypothetical protein